MNWSYHHVWRPELTSLGGVLENIATRWLITKINTKISGTVVKCVLYCFLICGRLYNSNIQYILNTMLCLYSILLYIEVPMFFFRTWYSIFGTDIYGRVSICVPMCRIKSVRYYLYGNSYSEMIPPIWIILIQLPTIYIYLY